MKKVKKKWISLHRWSLKLRKKGEHSPWGDDNVVICYTYKKIRLFFLSTEPSPNEKFPKQKKQIEPTQRIVYVPIMAGWFYSPARKLSWKMGETKKFFWWTNCKKKKNSLITSDDWIFWWASGGGVKWTERTVVVWESQTGSPGSRKLLWSLLPAVSAAGLCSNPPTSSSSSSFRYIYTQRANGVYTPSTSIHPFTHVPIHPSIHPVIYILPRHYGSTAGLLSVCVCVRVPMCFVSRFSSHAVPFSLPSSFPLPPRVSRLTISRLRRTHGDAGIPAIRYR